MAKRKGWVDLSADYQRRLQRKGITQAAYTKGTSLAGARGHAATPEHATVSLNVRGRVTTTRTYAALGVRAGILDIIPNFETLTRAEQNRLGKLYVKSFFERGTGSELTKAERRKLGLHPKDRHIRRHAGDEQINGRMEFEEWVSLNRSMWKDSEDYAKFRGAYATFSVAA